MPDLVAAYGDIAATVAADFFEDLRAEAEAPGRHGARLAAAPAATAVLVNVKWASSPMFQGDRTGTLGRLNQVADQMALQVGRDTIDRSVRSDPAKPKWARVPSGADTCAFCLALASRGAVYGSAASAGHGHKWHAGCDCTPTPIWKGSPLPDGYDPDALYQSYAAARSSADGDSFKGVLSELRKQRGSH
jgi:hypothetical protein